MKSIEHTINVKRRAHYYTNSFEGLNPKFVWIVAHGYGQIAERILSKFTQFDAKDHLVICPEGLSLFYWGGVSGSYAASWMTSKNRLDEIDDFCDYFDLIYDQYVNERTEAKIILFGFSQGATTLYRWIQRRKCRFDFFINWAGWFPEDIEMKVVKRAFLNKHLIVYGTSDQYLRDDKMSTMKSNLKREGFYPIMKTFEGKHVVDSEVLIQIFNQYLK